MYQLADNKDIFRAATASGGDLLDYFLMRMIVQSRRMGIDNAID
jgi:hypothetical protein